MAARPDDPEQCGGSDYMYRVLFAEDELLIRLGLQNSIPWNKYDMDLTAQADNGVRAFELFQEIRPDVVITDIRMEGMDGFELIQRIRELDKECAIIVLSCLDDFETLRKMIPYKIIAYILKASMTMEEIFQVLQKTKEYLEKAGRRALKESKEPQSLEMRLAGYMSGTEQDPEWPMEKEIQEIHVFSLKEEDQDKINSLAMKFVFDLVRRQVPEGIIVQTKDQEFCLLLPGERRISENVCERINHSVEDFLGVRFWIRRRIRQPKESLRELYQRIQKAGEEGAGEWENDQVIQDAVSYVQGHYQENLTLTDISSILGISPSYFSHLFKKKTGKNYVEFVNEIRLKAVMEDLKNSDFKIAVIAEKNGFRNFEYFSRLFKKATGVSPAKWRQQNR